MHIQTQLKRQSFAVPAMFFLLLNTASCHHERGGIVQAEEAAAVIMRDARTGEDIDIAHEAVIWQKANSNADASWTRTFSDGVAYVPFKPLTIMNFLEKNTATNTYDGIKYFDAPYMFRTVGLKDGTVMSLYGLRDGTLLLGPKISSFDDVAGYYHVLSKPFKVNGKATRRLTSGQIRLAQMSGPMISEDFGGVVAKMTYTVDPNLGFQGDYVVTYPNSAKVVLNYRLGFRNQIYGPGSYFVDAQGLKYTFDDKVPSPVQKMAVGYSAEVKLFTETAVVYDKGGKPVHIDLNSGVMSDAEAVHGPSRFMCFGGSSAASLALIGAGGLAICDGQPDDKDSAPIDPSIANDGEPTAVSDSPDASDQADDSKPGVADGYRGAQASAEHGR